MWSISDPFEFWILSTICATISPFKAKWKYHFINFQSIPKLISKNYTIKCFLKKPGLIPKISKVFFLIYKTQVFMACEIKWLNWS